MKKLTFPLFLLLIITLPLTAQNTVWEIDPAHTKIQFAATHLAISEVSGQFQEFSGTVKSDQDDFSDVSIDLTIQANSLDTDNEKRDKHLKSEDFFHVEKYPVLTFKSKSMEKTGNNEYKLTGDLTIHGVTKPATLDVTHKGTVEGMQGETRAGFKVKGNVNRFDYGIDWNNSFTGGLVVGKEIDITCDVELIKQ